MKILPLFHLCIFFVLGCTITHQYPTQDQITELIQAQSTYLKVSLHAYKDYNIWQYLKQLETHIRHASNINEIDIDYYLTAIDRPSAFVDAKNTIYIDSSFFYERSPYHCSESEIAAILAHEIGHILKRHHIKQLYDNSINVNFYIEVEYKAKVFDWEAILYEVVSSAICMAWSDYCDHYHDEVARSNSYERHKSRTIDSERLNKFYKSKTLYTLIYGYSIENEIEADKLAIDLLQYAGFSSDSLKSVLDKELQYLKASSEDCTAPKHRDIFMSLEARLNNLNERVSK